MIKIISLDYTVYKTQISIPFEAICSVTDKMFKGEIIVEYKNSKNALEYVSLEKCIKEITSNKLLAEDIGFLLMQKINNILPKTDISILIDVHHSEAHQPVKIFFNNGGNIK